MSSCSICSRVASSSLSTAFFEPGVFKLARTGLPRLFHGSRPRHTTWRTLNARDLQARLCLARARLDILRLKARMELGDALVHHT